MNTVQELRSVVRAYEALKDAGSKHGEAAIGLRNVITDASCGGPTLTRMCTNRYGGSADHDPVNRGPCIAYELGVQAGIIEEPRDWSRAERILKHAWWSYEPFQSGVYQLCIKYRQGDRSRVLYNDIMDLT